MRTPVTNGWKLDALSRMVARQIEARGVKDPRVLEAMRRVDRSAFVPPAERASAFEDHPLPIGCGQTISQPFIVALMTEALRVEPDSRVLEIGFGSGYQSAVLLEMEARVYGVELVQELARAAIPRLEAIFPGRFQGVVADGSLGWPGPRDLRFDRILVAAAAPKIPLALTEQLAPGGILVIPVGDPFVQKLERVTIPDRGRAVSETIEHVRFVPLIGREGFPR